MQIKTTVRCHFTSFIVTIINSSKCWWGRGDIGTPHSSTFAWKIPWTEEPGRLQSMGSLESDTTERLHFHFSLSCIGEGNGNPLQCSCLENPRDGKPGGLPSMGSHRVGHDWSDLAAAAAVQLFATPWTARLLCLPLALRVCSNSCPLRHWSYLIISSSVAPFSFFL